MTSIASLTRYPLSVVLSYLDECDGTSALITNKPWSRRVLPHFALRRPLVSGGSDSGGGASSGKNDDGSAGNIRRIPQTRHSYRVYPVQDADTLLARLNTRRLAQRLAQMRRERLHGVVKAIDNKQDGNGGDDYSTAYQLGLDTNDLAMLEWQMQASSDQNGGRRKWPAELELLLWREGYSKKASSLPVHVVSPKPMQVSDGVIVLASYPRSGNTLLRSLLERTTLCVTGSDTRPDRTLSRALAEQHNLVGEGIVRLKSLHPVLDDANVGVVKTHWPERKGCLPYATRRAILLVRNPYDAIDSYWNLCVTNTHTESVVDSIYERYADKFRALALSEMKTWIRFHSFWLDQCRERGMDICVVRYEDLVTDVEGTFRDVMKFVLDAEDGQDLDAFWEGRLRHVLGVKDSDDQQVQQHEGCISRLGSYRPRSANDDSNSNAAQGDACSTLRKVPPAVGKSLLRKRRYCEETLRKMHDAAALLATDAASGGAGSNGSLLKLFGYDIFDQGFPYNFIAKEPSVDQIYRGVHMERRTNLRGESGLCSPMKVNVGAEIRPHDDPYGRAMTNWRKGETSNDTEPFPTMPRLKK